MGLGHLTTVAGTSCGGAGNVLALKDMGAEPVSPEPGRVKQASRGAGEREEASGAGENPSKPPL
ncbi:MAG: hypothetical protein LBW85_00900 [Deltaproteobacteria bacterium]|jgi:hypothetical protein|nr:hypothetical protein [Deltaproteobacteria bacterium]